MNHDRDVLFNPVTNEVEIHGRESISIQELYNRARDWECFLPNLSYPHVFDGEGKRPLPDGTVTDITATLNRDWKIHAFSDKKSTLIIYGGNLRRHDNSEPIVKDSKVNVILEQATTLSREKQYQANSITTILGSCLLIIPFVVGFAPLEDIWKFVGAIIGLQGGYFLPISRKRFSE